MNNLKNGANIIIFGGNGDLAKRKLLPAFYNLYLSGHLPENFSIIGVHHKPIENADYRNFLLEGINKYSRTGQAEAEKWNTFSEHIQFFTGDFTQDEAFARLNEIIMANDAAWGTAGCPHVLLLGSTAVSLSLSAHCYLPTGWPLIKHWTGLWWKNLLVPTWKRLKHLTIC